MECSKFYSVSRDIQNLYNCLQLDAEVLMLTLQAGIKIFCPHAVAESNSRIWLSSGTVSAIAVVPDADCYCAGAIVPQQPWREPTSAELALLWAETPPPREIGIGIVQVPSAILDTFMAEGVGLAATVDEARVKMRQDRCQSAIAQLLDFFTPFCLSDDPPTINGMGACLPGLWTSTLDRQRQCRNGLHTDNWDKLAVNQKHRATNRICVNLGCEDRYFLFINLPEIDLLDQLSEKNSVTLNQSWSRTSTEQFMTRHPEYPVIKLKIAPGEAYIAPTENIIHDGSTIDKHNLDIKVMMRGHYQIHNPTLLNPPC